MIRLNRLLMIGFLGVAACDGASNNTDAGPTVKCGQGTMLVNNECVEVTRDLAQGAMTECGSNTMLANGKCEVGASTCQQGTTFDATLHVCKPTEVNLGTPVANAKVNFQPMFHQVFYQKTDADGGVSYAPVGTVKAQDAAANLAGTTKLYTSTGRKIGGANLQYRFPIGPLVLPTELDPATHVSLDDYKKCSGTVEFYKPTPAVGSKYRVVINVAGCYAYHMYSLWFLFTPTTFSATWDLDAAWAARSLFTSGGGVPNFMITDANGAARYERLVDSKLFEADTECSTCAAHVLTNGKVQRPPATGALFVALLSHLTGQSNGNPGSCPMKADGTCANPTLMGTDVVVTAPFPDYILGLGRLNNDAQFADVAAIPLSAIQPF